MLIEVRENEKKRVLDYIGKDYGKCLYVFIDLCKYSLDDNDNFFCWVQEDESGKITAAVTEYYKGIQVYSRDLDLDEKEITDFVRGREHIGIFGIKETVDRLHKLMPEYEQELGTVGELMSLTEEPAEGAYSAPLEEMEEIAALVAEDEAIGKPYGYESLLKQYRERKEESFGRNFLLRDEATGEIICHAGTYAELPELAVIGGVITSPKYRGKGKSKGTLAAICKELKDEGKDVFSFYYIPQAKAMHEGTGFRTIGIWAKLVR